MNGRQAKTDGSGVMDQSEPLPFKSIRQIDVPKGRDGKHKRFVTRVLSDIEHLKPGLALKIPLSQLPDSKENIRSALSRAARQKSVELATSSSGDFLYIWKKDEADVPAGPGSRK